MSWLDPEKIKKWKPLAILFLVAGIISAVGKTSGTVEDVWEYYFSSTKYAGRVEVGGDVYFSDNERFFEFLERNIGGQVNVDMWFSMMGFPLEYSVPRDNAVDCYDRNSILLEKIHKEFGLTVMDIVLPAQSTVIPIAISGKDCSIITVSVASDQLKRLFADGHGVMFKLVGTFFVAKSETSLPNETDYSFIGR